MPAWKQLAALTAFGIVLGLPLPSYAQGCSLCKDATAGSAPRQRQALRRAILIMGVPASGIFLGILVLARRIKPREEPDANSFHAPN